MHSADVQQIEIDAVGFETAFGDTKAYLPWVVCFTASLFFFYEFIQMNLFNAISTQLMTTFQLNETQIGELSSTYFWANIIFLCMAGSILDRISTRRVMLASLSICVLGTFFFSMVENAWMAAVCRFFTGIGSAFCFLSCIRLASRWFPPKRMALISGLVVTMAMLGGVVAQTPMTLLANALGWREAVRMDAYLGLVIVGLIWMVVQDYPPESQQRQRQERTELKSLGFFHGLSQAFFNRQNWLCGGYTCLLNLPIFLLGGLFGAQYLERVHGFTNTDASLITSMLFLGTTVGSPFMGWLSDQLSLRKVPMLVGAFISLFLILSIMWMTQMSWSTLMVAFFLLGFITSTQVISYPTVAESNSRLLTATSVSVVSLCAISGGAIFDPFFGWLMDKHYHGALIHGLPSYTPGDYQFAMWVFPVCFVVGLVLSYFIRETNCRRQEG